MLYETTQNYQRFFANIVHQFLQHIFRTWATINHQDGTPDILQIIFCSNKANFQMAIFSKFNLVTL
jgi:hypothetical protein